jgi:hypothetical protein
VCAVAGSEVNVGSDLTVRKLVATPSVFDPARPLRVGHRETWIHRDPIGAAIVKYHRRA